MMAPTETRSAIVAHQRLILLAIVTAMTVLASRARAVDLTKLDGVAEDQYTGRLHITDRAAFLIQARRNPNSADPIVGLFQLLLTSSILQSPAPYLDSSVTQTSAGARSVLLNTCRFLDGTPVVVQARAVSYQGVPVLVISSIQRCPP